MSNNVKALKIETDGTLTEITLDGTDPLATIRTALGEHCTSAIRVACHPYEDTHATDFNVWLDEDAPARRLKRNHTAAVLIAASQADPACSPVGTAIVTGTAGNGTDFAPMHEGTPFMVRGALMWAGYETP